MDLEIFHSRFQLENVCRTLESNLRIPKRLVFGALSTTSTASVQSHAICVNHYDNTPLRYTEMLYGCKNDNYLHLKTIVFAQNIDCRFTLEQPK